jgi:hypothetical protein
VRSSGCLMAWSAMRMPRRAEISPSDTSISARHEGGKVRLTVCAVRSAARSMAWVMESWRAGRGRDRPGARGDPEVQAGAGECCAAEDGGQVAAGGAVEGARAEVGAAASSWMARKPAAAAQSMAARGGMGSLGSA